MHTAINFKHMKLFKTLILFTLLAFTFLSANAQVRVETQLGGSNFLGVTLNTVFDIPLSSNKKHNISPGFGVGMLVLGSDFYYPLSIIKFGLHYRFANWGIGGEVSGFSENPFLGNIDNGSFYNVLVYPNINHMFPIKENWYLNLSIGYIFFFEKYYLREEDRDELRMSDEVLFSGGISFGYKF